jgi:hypothetical protein
LLLLFLFSLFDLAGAAFDLNDLIAFFIRLLCFASDDVVSQAK